MRVVLRRRWFVGIGSPRLAQPSSCRLACDAEKAAELARPEEHPVGRRVIVAVQPVLSALHRRESSRCTAIELAQHVVPAHESPPAAALPGLGWARVRVS